MRDGADTLTAALKALFILLIGGLVVTTASLTIYRDLVRHTIAVTIDPKAAALLADLGTELDLPSVFVDEVNTRFDGVRQIISDATLFKGLSANGEIGDLSLKPVGLDVTTSEVEAWLRSAFDLAPPYRARLGLVCLGGPCDAVKLAGLDPGASQAQLLLRIDLQAGDRHQSVTFPLPARNPSLRRGLREAMKRGSEAMLETAEPLAAGIYYLNSAFYEVFRDTALADTARAAGMTFPERGQAAYACLADIVFADSLAIRGDAAAARVTLLRRMQAAKGDMCEARAAANLSILEGAAARCLPDPALRHSYLEEAQRNVDTAIALGGLNPGQVARLRFLRAEIVLEQAFLAVMSESARGRVCPIASPEQPPAAAPSAPASSSDDPYRLIPAAITTASEAVEPGIDDTRAHDLLILPVNFADAIAPEASAPVRYAIADAIDKAANRYLGTDTHPHALFLAKGRAALQKALAAYDFIGAAPEVKYATLKSLGVPLAALLRPDPFLGAVSADAANEAIVAFEDADVTEPASPLVEPGSRLEAKVRQGDALYALGRIDAATASWQEAVDRFADLDEPREELVWLARAAAHWGAVLIDDGACAAGSDALTDWRQSWSRLGLSRPPSPCEAPPPALSDALAPLRALVAQTWQACPREVDPARPAAGDPVRRRAMLRCFDATGAGDPARLAAFLATPVRQIDAALARSQ